MTHLTAALRALPARAALLVVALATLLGLTAAPASAAPVTYEVGYGAKVTLSSDTFTPGEQIFLTGTGFTGTGGSGEPRVAVKLNDLSDPFTYDGATEEFEPGLPTFQTFNGNWSGWVRLPANISATGPGAGANAGKHWLRILSGVPTSGNNVTMPITYQAYFTVVDGVQFGFTAAGGTFYSGTTVSAGPVGGGTYTAKGAPVFPANTAVTATYDGNALTLNPAVTTDADGRFTTNVVLPATPVSPLTPGKRNLVFTAGTVSKTVELEVVAHTITLLTPQVRAGSTVAARFTGFLGIGGKPQKVGLVDSNDKLLACVTGDASGSGLIAGTFAAGATAIRVNAGANCAPPAVSDPSPRGGAPLAVMIADTAPQGSTTFAKAAPGVAVPVTGAGFGAGESVAVQLDGVPVGAALTADASGGVAGSVTLPAGTATGAKVLTFVSATKTAADTLEIVAPAAVKITSGTAQAGGKVTFDLTGFVRGFARADGALGQKVGVRIDDARTIVACVQTDDAGSGSGSVDLPADLADGDHTLRFLAGSSCVSGSSDDLPSRSLTAAFASLTARNDLPQPQPAPPATTQPPVIVDVQKPTKLKGLKGGKQLQLTIDAGDAASVKISVKTTSKVKLTPKAKPKIVTIAKATTVKPTKGKSRTVKLTLTKDGRALLKARGKVKVTVTIDPTGTGTATKRTFTLRG